MTTPKALEPHDCATRRPITCELSRGADESDTYTSLVWNWAIPVSGVCPVCGSGVLASNRDLEREDGILRVNERFTECADEACGWWRME